MFVEGKDKKDGRDLNLGDGVDWGLLCEVYAFAGPWERGKQEGGGTLATYSVGTGPEEVFAVEFVSGIPGFVGVHEADAVAGKRSRASSSRVRLAVTPKLR